MLKHCRERFGLRLVMLFYNAHQHKNNPHTYTYILGGSYADEHSKTI
jgi:hypothetical protein